MNRQLEIRLAELQGEFEKGQRKLKEMETESSSLRDTLLRISGALQVLQEELDKYNSSIEFSNNDNEDES